MIIDERTILSLTTKPRPSTLMNFFIIVTTVCIAVLYASIFEWILHRYVMHRKVKFLGWVFDYPYNAHHLVHHDSFSAGETYHLGDRPYKVAKTIRMALWNGPFLTVLASIPSIPFSLWLHTWSVTITCAITIFAYYCTYEYIHWCMHLPKARRIEKGRWFQKLNGHHLLHHRFKGSKNFNVVLPFADWLFGTLMLRAPKPFDQAKGPSVPDVQPRP